MPEDIATFLAPLGKPPAMPQLVVGIDWGEKRIGLAQGNLISRSARPWFIYPVINKKRTRADLIEKIHHFAPHLVVVGIPLTLDGQIQETSRRARKFAQSLYEGLKIPFVFQQETLTSVTLSQNPPKSAAIDDLAAREILQAWIDSQ